MDRGAAWRRIGGAAARLSLSVWFASLLATGVALAIVAASAALVALTHPPASTFDLGFGFGPHIASVAAGHGLGDGTRSPLIPYFLGSLARVSSDVLVATVIKNLVVQSGLALALLCAARGCRERWQAITLVMFIVTFPQLQRVSLALVPEEGWLIAMIAFLFHGLMRARRAMRLLHVLPYAIICGLVLLTKSNMVLVAPAFAGLFAWRTRRFAVLAMFAAAIASAALLIGLGNLRNGHFAITSSIDGYNFWKGNNASALDYFPDRSLDLISHLAPPANTGDSEWTWSRDCYRAGITWNVEHPGDAARMAVRRIWQFFVSVSAEEPPVPSTRNDVLRRIGVPHMVVFRLLFVVSLAAAVRAVVRRARVQPSALETSASDKSSERKDANASEQREVSLAYLVLVVTVAAPHMVAFGTQRHVLPLVVPTVLYAAATWLGWSRGEPSQTASSSSPSC